MEFKIGDRVIIHNPDCNYTKYLDYTGKIIDRDRKHFKVAFDKEVDGMYNWDYFNTPEIRLIDLDIFNELGD